MASFSTVSIKFAADLRQFSTEMQTVQRTMAKVGKQMQQVGAGLTIGLTAPIVALGFKSVQAFDKQAKAIAQVEAGVKSTGKAAGFATEQLLKMASDLQNKTIFGDEEILQGVTSQLLTFTNIASTQFERTQLAALNLSTRLDGDLKSASIQLGKALNDPVANLSALSRSGIQFSTEQKEVIKQLANTNRLADAQTIILNELENQYGGAAEAAAKAGTGPFKQLSNTLGDILEDFGKIISEALLPFISKLKDLADRFQALDPSIKKTIAVVAALAAALGPVLATLGFLVANVLPGLVTAFAAVKVAMLATPWGLIAAAVGATIAVIASLSSGTEKLANTKASLASITKTATNAIAEERAEVEKLLFIARDENVSKEQRIKAVQKLNSISPKYLGNLTLETINTDKARIAVEKYNEALIQTAKAKAAQEKLQEIQKKIIEKELELSTRRKKILEDEGSLLKGTADNAASAAEADKRLALAKRLVTIETENGTKALKEQEQILLEIIRLNGEVGNSFDSNGGSTSTGGRSQLQSVDPSQAFQFGQVETPLDNLSAELPTKMDLIKNKFIEFKNDIIDVSQEVNGAFQGLAMNTAEFFGEFIGSLAAGQADAKTALVGLMEIVAGFMKSLGQSLIAAGVASEAFKNLFASGIGAIAAGAALIAASGVVTQLLKSGVQSSEPRRAFADGGIVYGPTKAIFGEYSGARTNPEVVAPLDKLKGMISDVTGGGNMQVSGEFRLRDRDLVAAIDQAVQLKGRLG